MKKKCTKCNKIKHLDLFKKQKQRPDGICSWCKECHKKDVVKYFKNNRDKANKNNRKYEKTEKGKLTKRRNKLIRIERERNQIKTLTKEQWHLILKEQLYRCNICNREFNDSLKPNKDHIIPLCKGGNYTKENIQALCSTCNGKKGSK